MKTDQALTEDAADGENQSPERQLLRQLPQRCPATMYDVGYQYALLDWYESVTAADGDLQIDPEHMMAMTPNAKRGLFGEPDSLIAVSVDLRDPENPRLDADDPVSIETMGADLRYRIGHSYPSNKTSSMTDYSITTHKNADVHHLAGLRDDAWGTNNIRDRFTGWAAGEAAQRVLEDETIEDRWVLEALVEIGENDAEMDRLSKAFIDVAGGDEEKEYEALITVRIRLPDADHERYPGEIPVLNEVMFEQKAERLANISVDDGTGDGVGFISDASGTVTGGSPGLFGAYGKKQREHFPNLSPSGTESWRSRPLSIDTALAIATADSVLDDFYRAMGQSRRLYVLPYLASAPEQLTEADITWFFETVFSPLREAEGQDFETTVEGLYQKAEEAAATPTADRPFAGADQTQETDAWESVRFATVFVVTGNPDRIFFETLDADLYRPRELQTAHNRVTVNSPFGDGGVFDAVASAGGSLLNPESIHRQILFGTYFVRTTEPTRTSREASETPKAGDIDDVRLQRLRRFLTGEQISPDQLIKEYVHKLVQDQNKRFDENSQQVAFPIFSLLEQYAQLRALTDIGALESITTTTATSLFTTHMSTEPTAETDPEPESRTEQLNQFIDQHDVLKNSPERQAIFLLGGLVGRLSSYQKNKNVSSTLVRRYPIDYLTKQSIKEVTKEVLQMNSAYIQADNRTMRMNGRYIDRLPELMLQSDPKSWAFTENELQWLYSLGIAYGIADTSDYDEESDDETEE
ncbi:TM1802 family CRISPR-associated protein [Haladaptatus sp. DYF46]|uniref:TM1802 family CRISPR-associated protein n=1 Tax=Haladaptatus sp. DYF46 TaxID=2886041 RepID=UPI001E52FAA4|nr:TM1802 family CRISPR-associated protein [Haladaptatus sp. DYF46]